MPTEWRNARGKSKWQPTLANGERLWWGRFYGGPMSGESTQTTWDDLDNPRPGSAISYPYPCLYSLRRAERIGRREQDRRDRKLYDKTYREVGPCDD